MILGQRAGLVGEDQIRGAEGLHRRQPLDDGIAPGHVLHAARERQRGDDRQALRYGGDGERNGRLQHHQQVLAGDEPGRGDDDGDGERQPDPPPAQRIEALLQRCRALLGLLDQAGDMPELGVHAGRDDQTGAGALGDRGALVGHVGPLAERQIVLVQGLAVLVDRLGLAGQLGIGAADGLGEVVGDLGVEEELADGIAGLSQGHSFFSKASASSRMRGSRSFSARKRR